MTPTRRDRTATRLEAVSVTMRWYNQTVRFVLLVALLLSPPALALDAKRLVGVWEGAMVFVVKKEPHRAPIGLEFKADGTAAVIQGGERQELRYEIKGNRVLLVDTTRSGNDLELKRIKLKPTSLKCEMHPTDRSRKPPRGFSLRLELKRKTGGKGDQ